MLDGAAPLPERRGIDHLRWVAQSNRIPSTRIAEVLDLVGMAYAARTRIRKYSLGMKQRLGLAAALLGSRTRWCSTNPSMASTQMASARSAGSCAPTPMQARQFCCRAT